MTERIEREQATDILILGGGLAGMHAAVAARAEQKRVTLLCKSLVGLSGSSLVSLSVHRFAPADAALRDKYRQDFYRSAAGETDPALAETLIMQGADAVEAMRNLPLPLTFRSVSTQNGAYDYLACCPIKYGRNMTEPLRNLLAADPDVRFVERTMAFRPVVTDGRIRGVLALTDGRIRFFPANAVVLATGGAGGVYSRTSNTSDLTGDGYAMALACGLPLTGMEFVQFYPYRICSPAIADIFPDIFRHGARYLNGRGERFMDAYPQKELENRDVLSAAMWTQDRVLLDCSGCDADYLETECPNIAALRRRWPDAPLLVEPAAHFFMGGVSIQPNCATAIDGLYACGEVIGGLHGANRLSGSALTETAVFGRIAGTSAARQRTDAPPTEAALQRRLDAALAELPCLGSDDPLPLKTRLREAMWQGAGVLRTHAGLEKLRGELADMAIQHAAMRPQTLKRWLELGNLITTAQAVAEAAVARPASLGAHRMADKNA